MKALGEVQGVSVARYERNREYFNPGHCSGRLT